MIPRNMTLFRFATSPCFDVEAALHNHAVRDPGPLELATSGFAPILPSLSDQMSMYVEGSTAFVFACNERLLPASAVNDAVAKKVQAIAQTEGRKVGSRERKRIKQDVFDEMLPSVPVRQRRIRGWMDERQGWLVIDCSSRRWSEAALTQLREAFGSFPAVPLVPEADPRLCMTEWVAANEPPEHIALGDEAELHDRSSHGGAVATLRRQELDSEEVQELLRNGKSVAKLGLTFNERLDLVLTESLDVKRVRATDVFHEERGESEDPVSQARADLTLAVLEVRRFLDWMETTFRIARPQEA
jgi:recombination associated protein RdgC